jgi:hypothetical protein
MTAHGPATSSNVPRHCNANTGSDLLTDRDLKTARTVERTRTTILWRPVGQRA